MRKAQIVSLVFTMALAVAFSIIAEAKPPVEVEVKQFQAFSFDCSAKKYKSGKNAGDDAHCVREAGLHKKAKAPTSKGVSVTRNHSVGRGFQVTNFDRLGRDTKYLVCAKKRDCVEYTYPRPGVTVHDACIDFDRCYQVDLAETPTPSTK